MQTFSPGKYRVLVTQGVRSYRNLGLGKRFQLSCGVSSNRWLFTSPNSMPSPLLYHFSRICRRYSVTKSGKENDSPVQQSSAPVKKRSEKKAWSRRKKIVIGLLVCTLSGLIFILVSIGYALMWISEMSYGDFLFRAFNYFDDDGDGVVRVEDLQSKWSIKLKEVTTECSDNVCDDAFKLFWNRLAPAVENCLAKCNNPVNIYDFNDLVAAVMFTVVDVDENEYISEADIRSMAEIFPDRDESELDQLIEWVMRECDLDNDGRISLRDLQFRLRAELEADGVQVST